MIAFEKSISLLGWVLMRSPVLMRPKKVLIILVTSGFHDATHSCTCSLVTSKNIARAKWRNSPKNISLLKCCKLCNIMLRVKCYQLCNITAATAKNIIHQFEKIICIQ